MGVSPCDVDTSFCTETEIADESTLICLGDEEQNEIGHKGAQQSLGLQAPSCNSRDISVCSEDEFEDYPTDGRNRLRGCVYSRPCSLCVYLFLVLLLLSSFVSIVVIGILVVGPYHQAANFLPIHCSASHVTVDKHERKCSCGKGCSSNYPCLQIVVTIPDFSGSDGTPTEAMLAEDESALHRQCSFYPLCKSSLDLNYKAVRQYENDFGVPGQSFTCLYNPNNPREVIRTRRFQLHHVVHGIIWPLVIFLLSMVFFILILRHTRCGYL